MYRVGILKINGDREAHNFKTKEECEVWLLENCDELKIKKAIIMDKENTSDKEIINF